MSVRPFCCLSTCQDVIAAHSITQRRNSLSIFIAAVSFCGASLPGLQGPERRSSTCTQSTDEKQTDANSHRDAHRARPSQFVRSSIYLRGSGTLPTRVTMQAEIATLLDGRDRFDPEILTPKLEAYVDEQVAAAPHSICRGTTPMRAACTSKRFSLALP